MQSPVKVLARIGSFVNRLRAVRAMRGVEDSDQLLDFFEAHPGDIFKPLQKRTEIRELFLRVRKLRPQAVLEIGTNNGGTLFLFCRAAAPDAVVISLDLPGGLFGGGYSTLRIPYYRAFGSRGQRVRLLRADSHSPASLAAVKRAATGRPIDFLFVDGDHAYDGVRQDFYTFGALVRPGGLIAFHDILPAPEEIGGGVPRFWAEVKNQYAAEEFVEDRNQGMMGIGLIQVPTGGITPPSGGKA
jgi:predicted O-methyltransferase YrrM